MMWKLVGMMAISLATYWVGPAKANVMECTFQTVEKWCLECFEDKMTNEKHTCKVTYRIRPVTHLSYFIDVTVRKTPPMPSAGPEWIVFSPPFPLPDSQLRLRVDDNALIMSPCAEAGCTLFYVLPEGKTLLEQMMRGQTLKFDIIQPPSKGSKEPESVSLDGFKQRIVEALNWLD